MAALYQVVLEHVYLSVLLRVVGSAALVVDDRGGAVVLVFGGVRVEDVHGALFLGLRGLCRVLDLLLRLVLREESVLRILHAPPLSWGWGGGAADSLSSSPLPRMLCFGHVFLFVVSKITPKAILTHFDRIPRNLLWAQVPGNRKQLMF